MAAQGLFCEFKFDAGAAARSNRASIIPIHMPGLVRGDETSGQAILECLSRGRVNQPGMLGAPSRRCFGDVDRSALQNWWFKSGFDGTKAFLLEREFVFCWEKKQRESGAIDLSCVSVEIIRGTLSTSRYALTPGIAEAGDPEGRLYIDKGTMITEMTYLVGTKKAAVLLNRRGYCRESRGRISCGCSCWYRCLTHRKETHQRHSGLLTFHLIDGAWCRFASDRRSAAVKANCYRGSKEEWLSRTDEESKPSWVAATSWIGKHKEARDNMVRSRTRN